MSGARQGRRRRILQEEVLNASRELAAHSPEDQQKQSGEGRRYALSTGSLGGALAKRHFPNHAFVPIAIAASGVLSVAGLAALDHYRSTIASFAGPQTAALLDAASPTSLASWLASSAMLAVAGLAMMILAVRRRRVDDYKGRHRLWRGAVAVAVLLSLDAATQLHTAVGEGLAGATGIQLMGGKGWWLLLGGAVVAWVAGRVVMDIRESKLALTLFVAATVAGGVAVVGPMAGLGGPMAALIAKLAQVAAYSLAASSLVAYTRFLRRDVSAGIATKPQKARTAEVKIARETTSPKSKGDNDSPKAEPKTPRRDRKAKPAKAKAQAKQAEEDSRWTDGSDGYNENYDDEGAPRKLSKSERKRMRQQKAGRRAA